MQLKEHTNLKIFFAMEYYSFGLDFPLLNIYFVASKYNGNIFTNSDQVSVPVRNIFVCNTSSNVKHDNSTLSYNQKNTS